MSENTVNKAEHLEERQKMMQFSYPSLASLSALSDKFMLRFPGGMRDRVSDLAQMPDCKNIKALTKHQYDYRLRIGNYRVLFDWGAEVKIIEIQEVRKRDERTY